MSQRPTLFIIAIFYPLMGDASLFPARGVCAVVQVQQMTQAKKEPDKQPEIVGNFFQCQKGGKRCLFSLAPRLLGSIQPKNGI